MTMTRIAKSVRITGQVQGVFFRAWTKGLADQLNVAGWVRNCTDGSVEAHLEGDAEAVERMVGAMRRGPDGAIVARIEVAEAQVAQSDRFEVRK